MALIKEIILPNGIVTNYHRIHSITKNATSLYITVVSYVSEKYRQLSSSNNVDTKYYTFENDNSNISFEEIYKLLKTTDDFQDSLDN